MASWWVRVAIWRAWLNGAGVKKEPFLRDASGKVLDKDLRADFMALSVWERQRMAFFDNHGKGAATAGTEGSRGAAVVQQRRRSRSCGGRLPTTSG